MIICTRVVKKNNPHKQFILVLLFLCLGVVYTYSSPDLNYKLPPADSLIHIYQSNKKHPEDSIYFDLCRQGVPIFYKVEDDNNDLAGEIGRIACNDGGDFQAAITKLYDVIGRAHKTNNFQAKVLGYYFLIEKYIATGEYVKLCKTATTLINLIEEEDKEVRLGYHQWRKFLFLAVQAYALYS